MRDAVKSLLGRATVAWKRIPQSQKGCLLIVTFHRVRPDDDPAAAPRPMRNLETAAADFRRFLQWLSARYRPVHLHDALCGGAMPSPGEGPCMAVTFDDGWRDNATTAYPVLRELNIPATIFLSTAAIEERRPFWWQAAGLTDAEIEKYKEAPLEQLDALAAAAPGQTAPAEDFLSWGDIQQLAADPLIQFGLHGHRHALLDHLPRAEALADIQTCRDLIAAHVPAAAIVPILAWPNGNGRTDMEDALADLGIAATLGTQKGLVCAAPDLRRPLPRNNVDRNLAAKPCLWPWFLACAASATRAQSAPRRP